jgi:hypothetical protein
MVPLNKGGYRKKSHVRKREWLDYFFFFPELRSRSSPLRSNRRDFTSSRSIVISLSKAFAFASAMRFSSSISNSRFFRSVSNALIRSTVLLKLLKPIHQYRANYAIKHLKLLQSYPAKTTHPMDNGFNFYIWKGTYKMFSGGMCLDEENHFQKTRSSRVNHEL